MTYEHPAISELPYVRTSLTELMQENLHRPEWARRLMLGEVAAIAVPAVHVAADELTQLKKELGRRALERTGAEPVIMPAEELDRGSLTKEQEDELREGRPVLVHYCVDRFLALRGSAGRRVNPARMNRINNAQKYMIRQSIEYIGRILSGAPVGIDAGEAKRESIPELTRIWPRGTRFNTYAAQDGFLDRQFTAGDHVKVHGIFLPDEMTVGMSIQRDFEVPSVLPLADQANEQAYWVTVWRSAVLANQYAEKQFSAQGRLSKKPTQKFAATNVRQFVGFDRGRLTEDDVMPLAFFGAFDIGYVVRGVSSYFQQFEAAAAAGDVCRGQLARFNAHQVEYLCGLLTAPPGLLETFSTAKEPEDNKLNPRVMNHRLFLRHAMLRFRPLDWWLTELTAPRSRFDGFQYVSLHGDTPTDARRSSPDEIDADERLQLLHKHLRNSLNVNLFIHVQLPADAVSGTQGNNVYLNSDMFSHYGARASDAIIDHALRSVAILVLDAILPGRRSEINDSFEPYYYEDSITIEWCSGIINQVVCPYYANRRTLNVNYLARMVSNEELFLAKARGERLAAGIMAGYPAS